MQAIILAGGLGSRLKPITDYVPKPLIPINNIPLIEYQIRQLKKFKINQFVICTGYKTDQIQNYLEHKNNFDSKIQYSIEKTPLGTGGAIKKAAKMINDKSFLVLNGDIISTIDVRKLYPYKNAVALIELRTKFGTVDLNDSKITRFQEKKPLTNVWMNAGIYHLSKDMIPFLPSKGAIEETTFRRFAKDGKLIGIRFKDAFWHSIDSHKDMDDCSKALKDKKM